MNVPIFQKLLTAAHDNHPHRDFEGGKAAYITIHETDNWSPTADAANHALWMYNSAPYSVHEFIDDREIWQSLLPHQQGWHAGDAHRGGEGNKTSLALELCVNEGVNTLLVRENAAWRTAELIRDGHGYKGVVQHNHWSGKHCPRSLRDEGKWQWFLTRVDFYLQEGEMTDDEFEAQLRRVLGKMGWMDDAGLIDQRLREAESARWEAVNAASRPIPPGEDE